MIRFSTGSNYWLFTVLRLEYKYREGKTTNVDTELVIKIMKNTALSTSRTYCYFLETFIPPGLMFVSRGKLIDH